MIKPMKIALRIWIGLTAAVSFLLGWAMLAHAGKPAPLTVSAPPASSSAAAPLNLPALAPVPSLSDFANNPAQSQQGLQPLQIQPSSPFTSMPSLRTRGS
jgi:hypothetical protein